jgi:CelD/BcsL family acetyltransferase involved in cellulose biosynthesis
MVAPIEITEVGDLRAFAALGQEWNALVKSTVDEPFYRHEFLHLWMQAFAADVELRILTGRDATGRLTAALPLMRARGSLGGIPVSELVFTSNTHSCRFDLLAEEGDAAGRAFFDHLAEDPEWDVLRLIDVPEGGKAYSIYRAAQEAGHPTGVWESQRSPFLVFPRSEEELMGRLSGQYRYNVRRRRRQLSRKGELRVERVTDGDIRPAFEEFLAMERRGWKGRQGTACDQDSRTAVFYGLLAEKASCLGWLSFFRLKLDERTIAFHFGLTYGGTYYLPKLSYEEDLQDCSPGLVLLDDVLRDSLARKLSRCDFLGSDDEWKLHWSSGVLPHHWLFIFRDSAKGRLLRKLKFDWGPRLREHLTRP